jgi:uncharacterized surface protein with fasciclin (FAS1) repeats
MEQWSRKWMAAPLAAAMAVLGACAETTAPVGPADASLSRGAVTPTKPASGQTIVAIAAGNPAFTTLVAAVTCPGFDGALATALSAKGQRTVFAPTNAAFAKLGLNAGNVCTALPLATLQDILLYHVAPGARLAADVVASETIRMANGDRTTITVNAQGAFINQSKITATDIVASNGVIHVIDTVLLPAS